MQFDKPAEKFLPNVQKTFARNPKKKTNPKLIKKLLKFLYCTFHCRFNKPAEIFFIENT